MNDTTTSHTLAPLRPEGWADPAHDERSLRESAASLRQQAPLALAVFGVVMFLAVAYAVLGTPIYRADMLIQVDNKRPSTLDPSGLAGLTGNTSTLNASGTNAIQGELDIIKSRELLLKAVDATHADVRIDVANRFPVIGTWAARRFEAESTGLAPAPLGLAGFAWGGERLDLDRFEVPDAMLGKDFSLIVTDRGWTLADDNDRTVASGTVGQRVDFAIGTTRGSIRVATLLARPGTTFTIRRDSKLFVIDDLAEKLKVGETARQSNLIRLSYEHADRAFATQLVQTIGRLYVERSVDERMHEVERSMRFLDQQIPVVQAELSRAEEKLSAFRTRSNTIDIEEATRADFSRLSELEKNRIELEMRRQQLAQRYEADHPEVRGVEQQLATVRSAIARLNGEVNALPVNQRELLRLQRDVQTNAALYTGLLNNVQQLRVSRAAMTGNAQIVDMASTGDKPVRPRAAVTLSIGAGIGLVLACAVAMFAQAMRATLREPEDAERATGLPALVSIPSSTRQRRLMRMPMMPWVQGIARNRLLSLRAPAEPAVETLRGLYMTLMLSENGRAKRSLLIASPTGGVGKSFICANLAALMTMPTGAGPQRRVLLIEADLRRPRVQTYFGLAPGAGLAEVAMGDVSFEQVVKRDVLPNLDVLLPGKAAGNPADALMAPGLRTLLSRLEVQYDFVLIDSAPILPVGDTLAIAPFAMSTVLVAQADRTTPRQLREALRRLQGVGAHVDGVLFNGVRPAQLASRYGGAYALAY